MTLANALELAIGLTGLASVAALAVPALHANKYARLMARLKSSTTNYANQAEQQANRREALKQLAEHRDAWTPRKANCLVGGTVLAALSSAIGVLKALFV